MADAWNQVTGNRMAGLTLLLALLAVGCESRQPTNLADGPLKVQIANQPFELELALDNATRFRGLSGRKEIPPGTGMLFAFPAPRRLDFVMRDCFVPIDIAFLDGEGRIVKMHAMTVEPEGTPEHKLKRYSSRWPAQFAVEFAGGTNEQLGLQIGQKIDLPLDALKAAAR